LKESLNIPLKIAESELKRSVIKINQKVYEEALSKEKSYLTFGVKNTNKIPIDLFNKLRYHKKYLWLTVDKMADKGRSIDTDLINPLTYRAMTGSTSGGAINILKGINDFAIGTDGGGSVLAPALSCQLPSIIGAGLQLNVNGQSKSTDNYIISGSIGVIARSLCIAQEIMELLTDKSLSSSSQSVTNVLIPSRNSVIMPDGSTMYEKLLPYIKKLNNFNFIEYDLTGIDDRNIAVNKINRAFEENIADVLLTYEGPIDVLGYGETIPKMFSGKIEKQITDNSGKFTVKAANICKVTAVTIPSSELACGFVICGREGIDGARQAVSLAHCLSSLVTLPEVFTRYYLTRERYAEGFCED